MRSHRIAILLGLFSACAPAAVLFDSPVFYTPPNGNVGLFLRDSTQSGTQSARTFDTFAIAVGGTVNAVEWYGLYRDVVTPANNPVGPGTATWDIGFFADSGGAPGAALFTQSIAGGSVETDLIGTTVVFGTTVNVYHFQALLTAGFTAGAGTTYWFSPYSHQTMANQVFAWIQGPSGPGNAYQQIYDSGGAVVDTLSKQGNEAFVLENVPEPSTWLSVGGMLVWLARKRGFVNPRIRPRRPREDEQRVAYGTSFCSGLQHIQRMAPRQNESRGRCCMYPVQLEILRQGASPKIRRSDSVTCPRFAH